MMTAVLFVGGIVVAIAVLIWMSQQRDGPGVQAQKPAGAVAPSGVYVEGDGEFEAEVVGESFYQDAFVRLCGPKTEQGCDLEFVAQLVPDPANPYDENAVAVVIRGEKVGHLSRDDALAYRLALARTGMNGALLTCTANVTGGWRRMRNGKLSEGHYGVRLDISTIDAEDDDQD